MQFDAQQRDERTSSARAVIISLAALAIVLADRPTPACVIGVFVVALVVLGLANLAARPRSLEPAPDEVADRYFGARARDGKIPSTGTLRAAGQVRRHRAIEGASPVVAVTEGTSGLEARKAHVKSLQQATPLSDHSIWAPSVGRADPVTLLEEKAQQVDVLLRGRERAGHRGLVAVKR